MNVVNLNAEQTNDSTKNYGEENVALSQRFIERNKNTMRNLWIKFAIAFIFLVLVSVVDWSIMYMVLSQKYSDAFGNVDESKHIFIILASFATIAGFSFMSWLWSQGTRGKFGAVFVYLSILLVVSLWLYGDYQKLIATYLTEYSGFLSSDNTTIDSIFFWLKRFILLIVSFIYAFAGSLVAVLEHYLIELWNEMEDFKKNLFESESVVNGFNDAVKNDQFVSQQKALVDFLSDTATVDNIVKVFRKNAVNQYVKELESMLNSLSLPNSSMSRDAQTSLFSKRQRLEFLIKQAENLI